MVDPKNCHHHRNYGCSLVEIGSFGGGVPGFPQSLAHPGGDITGLSNFAYGLAANRVEYLKAIVPNLSRVALLDKENVRRNVEESQAAADKLKLFVRPIETRKPDDIAAAFSSGAARISIGLGVPSAP
jgi:putative tryptophan/tyrosine transport system substrate-binding protein